MKQFTFEDNLVKEGFWNELCSMIQSWRRSLGLSATDKVHITFTVNEETKEALTVLQKLNETNQVIGTDSKVLKLYDIASVTDAQTKETYSISDGQCFYWLMSGAPYICDKIHLVSIRVENNNSKQWVTYK